MSANDKTVTERVAVLRERKAFMAGAHWRFSAVIAKDWKAVASIGDEVYRQGAAQYAPLPTVTRPRVWVEKPSGMGFKVEDGELWYTCSVDSRFADWKRDDPRAATHEVTRERIFAWADLLRNPTETVEAES